MYEVIIFILLIIDQVSKFIIKNLIGNGGSIPVIDGIFHFTYVENKGAAFGMFQNMQYLFAIIALVVVVGGLYFIHKEKASKLSKISISMIISGAVGNVIDRIRLGYVVDFFDFKFIWSYVFNFADIMVVIGTFILCICLVVGGKDEV